MEPNEGDTIRVFIGCSWYETLEEFKLERFRFTLGFFKSEQDREAGNFTALSDNDIWTSGPDSKISYVSNYGEYVSNLVPNFEIIRSYKS